MAIDLTKKTCINGMYKEDETRLMRDVIKNLVRLNINACKETKDILFYKKKEERDGKTFITLRESCQFPLTNPFRDKHLKVAFEEELKRHLKSEGYKIAYFNADSHLEGNEINIIVSHIIKEYKIMYYVTDGQIIIETFETLEAAKEFAYAARENKHYVKICINPGFKLSD